MKSVRKKQIAVICLVLLVITAGYLQWSYNQPDDISTDSSVSGDAIYVGNDEISASAASEDTICFFSQAKLDRETMVSMQTSTLKEIFEDENSTQELRQSAYDDMLLLMEESETHLRLETMITEKGYEDAFVSYAEDGSIDIIIQTSTLTSSQVAQITDVITRQANIPIEKIHIRNKY